MKHILKPAVLVMMIALVFSSCKKEDDSATSNGNTPAPAPTKTQLLTAKPWKITGATISPAYMGMTDMFSMFDNCEKDNTMKFDATTKKVKTDEGTKKCDPADPQTSEEGWGLGNNETQLTMGTNQYTIVDLSATTLKLSKTMTMGSETHTMTLVYSAQ